MNAAVLNKSGGRAMDHDGATSGNSDSESPDTDGRREVRLLVFTSLFPNAAQPRHGIFVEERLRHLMDSGRVSATVVAPVPWFPFRHECFGRYADFAQVPACEERYGIPIFHPRYPLIPKIGMSVAPWLMYRALLPVVCKLAAGRNPFDLIDAHYFYPDGVVATWLGRALSKPVVITARGNDVTLIPRHRIARRYIKTAARNVNAIITVAGALKENVVSLGASANAVTVLRNGVDLSRFRPLDRAAVRHRLELKGETWLAVGGLVERKGVHIILAALAKVPDITLLIAGAGPDESALRRLAGQLGLDQRVRFLGGIPHERLVDYYNAADVMILASSREGMPNVVLESLACGTPVLATAVNGTPEVVCCPEAGELILERTPEAVVQAWRTLRCRGLDREAARRYAETLGWQPVIKEQCALYARVLRKVP